MKSYINGLGCLSEDDFYASDERLAEAYSSYEEYQREQCGNQNSNSNWISGASNILDLIGKGSQVANSVVDLSENWNTGNNQNNNQFQFQAQNNNFQGRGTNANVQFRTSNNNNTMLYVGLGVGALVLGGLAIWTLSK